MYIYHVAYKAEEEFCQWQYLLIIELIKQDFLPLLVLINLC